MPIYPTDVTEVPGLDGVAVGVGDRIAAAFRAGDTADMRLGEVVGLVKQVLPYSNDKILIEVQWEGYWAPDKPSRIDSTFKRFVRIDSEAT